jgi:hypothetical protein
LPRRPREKRVDGVGQKERETKRKEKPRGLPRGPGEKKEQEDGGGQKERGIKRIVKGTSIKEGPAGWRV